VLSQGVSPLVWRQVGRGGYGVQLFFVITALTLARGKAIGGVHCS
jgi:hypothetical protein